MREPWIGGYIVVLSAPFLGEHDKQEQEELPCFLLLGKGREVPALFGSEASGVGARYPGLLWREARNGHPAPIAGLG